MQEDDRVAGTGLAVRHRQTMDAEALHGDGHEAIVQESVGVGQGLLRSS